MTRNYFCVRHKSRRTRNQHFKLLYFKLNSHFGKSNYISACRKLNLLLINSICLVVSFLEMQRKLIQSKVHYKFGDSFSRHIVTFIETSVLKEVRISRYLRNSIAALIPKF